MGLINIISDGSEKYNLVVRLWRWLHHLPKKLVGDFVEIGITTRNIARDDPRRVTHSFKVGLAITLVSMFYYFQPLYHSFGVSAMWAVMTVVVVFEFTVGATLGKGLNRVVATLLAGGLGVGAHHLANLCGKIGEPILIGFFVFIFAAVTTFMRFFPKIKARYDYGLLIFILTFSLISISGYRADEILELAHKRLSTIAIGGFVSLMINIFIFPVWAGEELHHSISLNLEKLGRFLEEYGAISLRTESETNIKDEKISSLQSYRSVLNSKSSEDSMANFARWEPGHGHFRYNHPWNQYVMLGGLIRQCAYRIHALDAYFNSNELEKPHNFQEEFKDICTKISLESSKALIKLGSCLREMTYPSSSVNPHIVSSKAAVKSLKTFLKLCTLHNNQHTNLLQMIPIGTVASLLIDIVNCTEQITECANDLANLARFKKVIMIKDPNLVSKSKLKNVNQHDDGISRSVSEVNNCPTEIVIEVASLTLMMPNTKEAKIMDGQHSLDD